MKVWSREGEEAFGALALAESEWWSGDKSWAGQEHHKGLLLAVQTSIMELT
jgi:hypothetical protein